MRYLILVIFFLVFHNGFSQTLKNLTYGDTTYLYTDPEFELLSASSEGDTSKVLAFLELGTEVNTTTYEGVTPLMYAAQNGHLRLVEILIDKGADINRKPYSQIDALLGASISGYVEIVDTLILNGADVNTFNFDGVTPLMYAAAYNYYLLADVLLFYGAKVNAVDNYRNSALHYCSFYNNVDISALLLENDAEIEIKDLQGFTPLIVAAQNGHLEQIEYLTSMGADINAVTRTNLNALSVAIINNNYPVVDFLIAAGASLDHSVSININYADLAKRYASKEIQELIKSFGVTPASPFRIESIFFATDLNMEPNDFLIGGRLAIFEANSKTNLDVGLITRPGVRSVLIRESSNVLYQYWEQRSVMHLGITKNFLFFQSGIHTKAGALAGIKGAYTYGNFRGSVKKPNDQLFLIPKAGFYYKYSLLNMELCYEYMKFKNSKSSPHRINLSVGIKINLQKDRIKLKKEPYL
ncbi:MAG: ankyrin repeat domain-containing protein [Bacteroidales bacterium]|nr:ankyrin repeat domain-containing protein [Bacteroidales bacterium]MCF8404550.1 ankyrin repeat domain-containing protein [Bacteroidales bacterium]